MDATARCSAPHGGLVPKYGILKKASCRTLVTKHNQVPVRRSTCLKIKSSLRNKVFEDGCKGIVCYRDEFGEIVCEGYDEGPRFQPRISRTSYHPRDAEIMKMLQLKWLQIINGGEVSHLQDDFNMNGFNSLF